MHMEGRVAPKIKEMKATDLCVCGSGRTWKQCCGMYLEKPNCLVGMVKISEGTTVRFFLANLATDEAYEDEEGSVLVFTNQAQAISLNARLGHKYQIVGMTQTTWERFQREVPEFTVVTDAVA